MITPVFESNLAPYINGLITQKRALGYKYEAQCAVLKRFDELCAGRFPKEKTITKAMLKNWRIKKPTEKAGTLRNRVTPIAHLAEYMCRLGVPAYVFPTNTLPKEGRYVPHIYTKDELQRIFRQIDCCHYCPEVPLRHLIMPVMFRMLYCCGLRLGEVLKLEAVDVDLENGVLLIRESKYGNDRNVPMSEELTEICRNYAGQAHVIFSHKYFFPAPGDRSITTANVYGNFRRFLHKAGISHGGPGKGPRIYDLRHTFAVHCLKRMVLEGKDLALYHQILKTYMGHSFFKYTAYYLRLTKDMFPDIRLKTEAYYNSVVAGMECEAGV